jgi:hypothetical protein
VDLGSYAPSGKTDGKKEFCLSRLDSSLDGTMAAHFRSWMPRFAYTGRYVVQVVHDGTLNPLFTPFGIFLDRQK